MAVPTTLRQTPLTCSGHTRPVVDLAFSGFTEKGYFLISACKDGKPMIRQGDTGDWLGTFEGHKGAVWGVALSQDASKAASGAADFIAKVWDAVTGEEVYSFQHQHIVKCVAFSPDGSLLATGSNEKLLRIYDLNNPTADPFIISGHTSGLRHISFLGKGEKIVSCADDRTVRFWERSTGKEIHRIDFASIPNGIEVSSDDSILTVASGNTVSFWNTTNFEKIKEYQVPSQVHSASLHPSRSVFVCGGEDFKMYKMDYSNGQELESFKGHFGPVHCVRFSPDGELYASGSEDGTLRLWQTTVGKSYGLWKCTTDTPSSSEILSPVKAETVA